MPSGIAPLPDGSAVGSFVLRGVVSEDDFGCRYRASASASNTEVVIEEYLPAAIARREADGTLGPRTPSLAGLWAEGLQAFLQESEQMGRLEHPALLRIGAVWEARGTAYRLRANGEGRPLAQVVDAMTAPPDEPWLRAFMLPLLGALQAVHEAGWVHGNVLPAQIVLREDGSPVLLDSCAVRTVLGERLPGSAGEDETGFLPPELTDDADDAQVGPWSDLHALAQVLRYCITGQAPLPPESQGSGSPDARPGLGSRSLSARYSPGLVTALESALALDPRERPQSVAEFRQLLDAPPVLRAVPGGPALGRPGLPSMAPAMAAPRAAAAVPFPVAAARGRDAPAAPLEPAWAPAGVSAVDDRFEHQVFELPSAGGGTGGPGWAVAPRRSRPGPRWPWALGGMLAGAALTGALIFVALGPTADVRFALPSLGAEPPSAGGGPTAGLATGPSDAGDVLPAIPLPPRQEGVSRPATGAGDGVPVSPSPANAENDAPASMVREARVQDRAAPAPLPSGATPAPAPTAEDPGAAPRNSPPAAAAPLSPRTDNPAPAGPSATQEAIRRESGTPVAEADGTRAASLPETPLAACGPRSNFALYRCMQTQCEQGRFYTHPQCVRLRVRDELP